MNQEQLAPALVTLASRVVELAADRDITMSQILSSVRSDPGIDWVAIHALERQKLPPGCTVVPNNAYYNLVRSFAPAGRFKHGGVREPKNSKNKRARLCDQESKTVGMCPGVCT